MPTISPLIALKGWENVLIPQESCLAQCFRRATSSGSSLQSMIPVAVNFLKRRLMQEGSSSQNPGLTNSLNTVTARCFCSSYLWHSGSVVCFLITSFIIFNSELMAFLFQELFEGWKHYWGLCLICTVMGHIEQLRERQQGEFMQQITRR